MSKTPKTNKTPKANSGDELDDSEPTVIPTGGKSAVTKVKGAKTPKAKAAKTDELDGDAAPRKGRPSAWAGKKLKSTDYPCRAGTIRERFKTAFAKPIDVEAGLAKVLDGFEAPRSAAFKADPMKFVRDHVSTYISRGWLAIV